MERVIKSRKNLRVVSWLTDEEPKPAPVVIKPRKHVVINTIR